MPTEPNRQGKSDNNRKGLEPHVIHAQIRARNLYLRQVGKAAGVSAPMISQVIHRRENSPRVRRIISNIICLPYEVVWGVPDPEESCG